MCVSEEDQGQVRSHRGHAGTVRLAVQSSECPRPQRRAAWWPAGATIKPFPGP